MPNMYGGWCKSSRSGGNGGNLGRDTLEVSGAAFAALLHVVKSG